MFLYEIDLASGRLIGLRRFYQARTYSAALDGTPGKKLNSHLISILQAAVQRIFGNGPVHCIEPMIVKDADGNDCLPQIVCMGAFHCVNPTTGSPAHYSQLHMIWFQERMAPHISADNLDKIKKVDWDHLARDYDFDDL
jgi:hypothetical protein